MVDLDDARASRSLPAWAAFVVQFNGGRRLTMVPPRLTVIQARPPRARAVWRWRLRKLKDAEIIGADSMQVFRGMTVGTAAPTQAEQGGVPHHLIGCWDPSESVSVRRWSDATVGRMIECHPEL